MHVTGLLGLGGIATRSHEPNGEQQLGQLLHCQQSFAKVDSGPVQHLHSSCATRPASLGRAGAAPASSFGTCPYQAYQSALAGCFIQRKRPLPQSYRRVRKRDRRSNRGLAGTFEPARYRLGDHLDGRSTALIRTAGAATDG
jgi:hypothetical protein